ncbi:lytic transglycosylase domain-containing protein [Jannaschia marina]|uniref:lytic transglycosylase domain-containing protein n=1 Tax=Jannaschia marina TaxID=2741674 RepID=UPI0015C9FDED|nr:lytic transglycosylase domain-containing protein [Jannaschia marina]
MKAFLIPAVAIALSLTLPVAPASAEFTFKRVRPPASGTASRITVQITPEDFEEQQSPSRAPRPAAPEAPQLASARTAPSEPRGGRSNHQAWFWSAVSPSIEATPGRFTKAAQVAARPPEGSGVRAPSLAQLQAIAKLHGPEILARSVGTRVSPALVLALISVESGGRVTAVSNKGAQGLMQLIPATAERFGVSDANDPAQNIQGGIAYLDWLMGEFGNDPVLALAGYNAGEGAVRRNGGVPPYAETRAYVPKVLAAWNVARQMCLTPPVLPGDGCVFNPTLTDS